MTCQEFENHILDYLEGRLSPGDHELVGSHIAGCACCKELALQLKQLDTALTRVVRSPAMSADFNARLKQRIQASPVVALSKTECEERKRRFQSEYEDGLARLSLVVLPSVKWLETFGYAAAIAIAGLVAWRFLPQLADNLAASGLNIPGQGALPPLIVSAVFVLIGLAAAFPRQIQRLREAAFAR